ncbi:MAG TPA: elongation factor Ts [Candidatus Tenderia electrophaga]|uniref:Elongation factor Ts n=1 Tax=Candidatus Tenderia electrophaga TaxID=1748243 RepID=A0A832N4R9_9GAMM|nr:elongation factor Ts [Candidatus Tenderia electrophaga]
MAITAAQVKELRERTGAGMMECKKTLVETNGDIDAAIELMRVSGLAKADKKSDRVAAEGIIAMARSADGKQAVLVEVNCETDFVAKGDDFSAFAAAVADTALNAGISSAEALLEASHDGNTVEHSRKELIAKIGENITVRRVSRVESDGVVGAYMHGSRIGVLTGVSVGDEALAKDIAMHIAASKPVCVSADDVPAEVIEKEKEIFTAQAAESGKPPEIIEKMIGGRIKKFLKEITLVGQPFVKDPDQTIEKLLASKGATVTAFERLEVGEGIEKKEEDFVAEVMAQAKGA